MKQIKMIIIIIKVILKIKIKMNKRKQHRKINFKNLKKDIKIIIKNSSTFFHQKQKKQEPDNYLQEF